MSISHHTTFLFFFEINIASDFASKVLLFHFYPQYVLSYLFSYNSLKRLLHPTWASERAIPRPALEARMGASLLGLRQSVHLIVFSSPAKNCFLSEYKTVFKGLLCAMHHAGYCGGWNAEKAYSLPGLRNLTVFSEDMLISLSQKIFSVLRRWKVRWRGADWLQTAYSCICKRKEGPTGSQRQSPSSRPR